MSRTEDLEREEREWRDEQSGMLQHWAIELQTLGQRLWDEGHQNGWYVRMIDEPQLTVMVAIGDRNGPELARFMRDEAGIVGVFEGGKPERFANRYAAFEGR
jgi:hypothetical protein